MALLHLVLGDQLSHSVSALRDAAPQGSIVLMAEVMAEASCVRHHRKKIAFLFSAMRHFAEELRSRASSPSTKTNCVAITAWTISSPAGGGWTKASGRRCWPVPIPAFRCLKATHSGLAARHPPYRSTGLPALSVRRFSKFTLVSNKSLSL